MRLKRKRPVFIEVSESAGRDSLPPSQRNPIVEFPSNTLRDNELRVLSSWLAFRRTDPRVPRSSGEAIRYQRVGGIASIRIPGRPTVPLFGLGWTGVQRPIEPLHSQRVRRLAEESLRQQEREQDHDAPRPMRPPWLCALQPRDGIERNPHGAHQGDVCCRRPDDALTCRLSSDQPLLENGAS